MITAVGKETIMNLKETFITCCLSDGHVMVSTDENVFSGLVRSNDTAALIVETLKHDTGLEEITEKVFAEFDAPREVIERDVSEILEQLRGIGAVDE